jgi:hypothetical protein
MRVLSQVDFVELGKTLGVPALVIAFIFLLAAMYLRAMIPVLADKVKAESELYRAIAIMLPTMQREIAALNVKTDEQLAILNRIQERIESKHAN